MWDPLTILDYMSDEENPFKKNIMEEKAEKEKNLMQYYKQHLSEYLHEDKTFDSLTDEEKNIISKSPAFATWLACKAIRDFQKSFKENAQLTYTQIFSAQPEEIRSNPKNSFLFRFKNALKNITINRFAPVNLEWNQYNGLVFSILCIEATFFNRSFDADLLGIHISSYVLIYIFFIKIEFSLPF